MNSKFITIAFIVLTFYCFGAGVMDSFVIYHGWRFVSDPDFTTLHREQGARIIPFFVLAYVVLTILNILMFWFRLRVIPRHLVIMALLANITGWVSSALIQIPIQIQLEQGLNTALIEKLIVTDWIRVIASLLLATSTLLMLSRVCAASATTDRMHDRPSIKQDFARR